MSVDEIVAEKMIPTRSVLQRWINKYNANRKLKDYVPKREVYMAEARRKTTIDERKEIIEYCINHERNYKDTAALYDVSYSQVYSWVKKYDINGEDSLIDKRGHHKSDNEVDELERLRRENHRLKRQLEEKDMLTEFKIPGTQKKLYLSAILDLYDRYPVSHVISCRNENHLVFKIFDKTLTANPDVKPLLHSDRGFQYTSKMFKRKLIEQEMEHSMSRVGHCIDNVPTERLWGIIKSEMYDITDEASLRHAINDYIRFYSTERPTGQILL